MTNRLQQIERMETATAKLESALCYAKVIAKMLENGKTPAHSTLMEKIDLAIDEWNVLINLVPRELGKIKKELLMESTAKQLLNS